MNFSTIWSSQSALVAPTSGDKFLPRLEGGLVNGGDEASVYSSSSSSSLSSSSSSSLAPGTGLAGGEMACFILSVPSAIQVLC